MWRLLGTVHAENDNDPAAISAMMRAHKVQVNSRTHVPQKLTQFLYVPIRYRF